MRCLPLIDRGGDVQKHISPSYESLIYCAGPQLGSGYVCGWRGTALHFVRPADVRRREPRARDILAIASQRHVLASADGWKVHHLTAQMDDLGNIQRSKIVCEGIQEAREDILRVFKHRNFVSDILTRQADKRSYKKKKNVESKEIGSEPRQKLVNVMNYQILTRKQTYENLLKSLMEVVTNLEADYNVLKENEQKLEHLTGSFIKCIQQATNSHKQKLKTLKEIHGAFKKE
ncbi:hypothetical protein RR48_07851 [Papilio machaon]|uniref:Uncharacterized protein n=1 Tax=Papilio machaon TaxID=76193 RepID=A0A194QYW9_PAPMA|nr:hypothetical protein RR48_07851 [Papilio machaon]